MSAEVSSAGVLHEVIISYKRDVYLAHSTVARHYTLYSTPLSATLSSRPTEMHTQRTFRCLSYLQRLRRRSSHGDSKFDMITKSCSRMFRNSDRYLLV